jgi:hypothetical protein
LISASHPAAYQAFMGKGFGIARPLGVVSDTLCIHKLPFFANGGIIII